MGGATDSLAEAMDILLTAPSSPVTNAFREEVVRLQRGTSTLLGSHIHGEPREVVDAVEAVLQSLTRLLVSSVRPPAASADERPAIEAPRPSPVAELRALAEQLGTRGQLEDAAPPATPEQLWEWVHLRALCLPEDQADMARKSAAAIGREVDQGFPVPACPTFGYEGWDDSAVREEVQAVLGPDDALVAHVRLLATVLGVLDRFRPVQTAHEGFTTQPPKTIGTPADAARYRKLVLKLIAAEPASSLERALSCDEAIRSVYPWPLPALDSWWAARLQDSERGVRDLAKDVVLTVVDPAGGNRDLKMVNSEDRVTVHGTDDHRETALWPLRIGCRPEPRVTARALVVEPS